MSKGKACPNRTRIFRGCIEFPIRLVFTHTAFLCKICRLWFRKNRSAYPSVTSLSSEERNSSKFEKEKASWSNSEIIKKRRSLAVSARLWWIPTRCNKIHLAADVTLTLSALGVENSTFFRHIPSVDCKLGSSRWFIIPYRLGGAHQRPSAFILRLKNHLQPSKTTVV